MSEYDNMLTDDEPFEVYSCFCGDDLDSIDEDCINFAAHIEELDELDQGPVVNPDGSPTDFTLMMFGHTRATKAERTLLLTVRKLTRLEPLGAGRGIGR